MKKLLFGFALIAVVLFTGCPTPKTSNTTSTAESLPGEITLKEEIPPLKIAKSDVGKLKLHQNGYSIGSKTEWTELKRLLTDNENEIIEVVWIWDCSPQYDDMPMKIYYNKRSGKFKLIHTKTNVKEEYSDVSAEALMAFIDNGENSIYSLPDYSENSKYDFNNREMKTQAVGVEPKQSKIDGSVNIVEKYIKEKTTDASNIKFIEWSKVSPFDRYWVVRCKFEGENTLGEDTIENMWFYIQNGKVVKIKAEGGIVIDA